MRISKLKTLKKEDNKNRKSLETPENKEEAPVKNVVRTKKYGNPSS